MIVVVRSLKRCIPCFVSIISLCVSELYGHLCPYIGMYGLRLFILFYKNYVVYRIVYIFV